MNLGSFGMEVRLDGLKTVFFIASQETIIT